MKLRDLTFTSELTGIGRRFQPWEYQKVILISKAPEMLEKLKKAEEALRQVMQAKLPEEQWGLIVDCDSVLKEITDLLNIEIK